jgi:hypothetical protein
LCGIRHYDEAGRATKYVTVHVGGPCRICHDSVHGGFRQ